PWPWRPSAKVIMQVRCEGERSSLPSLCLSSLAPPATPPFPYTTLFRSYIRRASNDGKPLPPFDAASAARERNIADPADTAQPLEARARGYLHANCGHCHFEHGGGTVALRLQFSVPNTDMKAMGVRPSRGDFGLPDA